MAARFMAAFVALGSLGWAAAFADSPRARSSVVARSPHATSRSQQPRHLRHQATITSMQLYRKFHEYAWDKLLSDNGTDLDTVPEELRSNESPVKGAPPGTNVVAKIQSISQFPCLPTNSEGADGDKVLRLARSAFLETQTPTKEALITPMTIHVLNFVLFPSPCIRDDNGCYMGLPIFGADIVSLPGNKHLVALDLQPVLPLNEGDSSKEGENTPLIPRQYSHLERKLQGIHSKYQKSSSGEAPLLPWGGDIPEQAERFFSPYALWTRLADDNAMDTVDKVVWEAFQEYTNLYMELMAAVQKDINDGTLDMVAPQGQNMEGSNPVWNGQLDYLEYRRTNDPARPMLQRLYGAEWSESVIGDVLFPDLR